MKTIILLTFLFLNFNFAEINQFPNDNGYVSEIDINDIAFVDNAERIIQIS
jgi:hypothetical protein